MAVDFDAPMTPREEFENRLLMEQAEANPLFGHLSFHSYSYARQEPYLAMQEAMHEGRPFTRIAVYETDLV